MVDSLAMFFGAKKKPKKSSPKHKKRDFTDLGKIVVSGKMKKLYKGINGGLYYKTKSGRTYVDKKFVTKHKHHKSPKRNRRASPKRVRRASPKRVRRASPKRVRRASPKRNRYGIGLGQPSLLNMMGPAGLSPMIQVEPVHHNLGPGGQQRQPIVGPGGQYKPNVGPGGTGPLNPKMRFGSNFMYM